MNRQRILAVASLLVVPPLLLGVISSCQVDPPRPSLTDTAISTEESFAEFETSADEFDDVHTDEHEYADELDDDISDETELFDEQAGGAYDVAASEPSEWDDGDISVVDQTDGHSWGDEVYIDEGVDSLGHEGDVEYTSPVSTAPAQNSNPTVPARPAPTTPTTAPRPAPTTAPRPAPTTAPTTVAAPPRPRPVTFQTNCGGMHVALADADGWRNVTWLSGANQEMNIFNQGWNPSPSLGVLVGTKPIWIAVTCGARIGVERAEAFAVTTCGVLRVTNTTTGIRRVAWVADRIAGSSVDVGSGATTAAHADIRTNGGEFSMTVRCGVTETIRMR